jgi:hypothetical protein
MDTPPNSQRRIRKKYSGCSTHPTTDVSPLIEVNQTPGKEAQEM